MDVDNFVKRFFLALLIVLTGTVACFAQQFDYSERPRLNFGFQELKLELRIIPGERLLEGRAEYELQANIDGVDSLTLHAAHMDIERVQLDGESAGFRLGNDSLFVTLNQPTTAGETHTLDITYRTEPKFGVHFEEDSLVWTSFLPKSTRHWLPSVDHPRIRFRTEITIAVPQHLTALAPGRKDSEQILSSGEKRVRWISGQEVPATALWFAAGPFRTVETSIGVKRITVSGTSESSRARQELLEEAYDMLNALQDELGREYPFEAFHVIALGDHRWETKSYGAGSVFLFRDQQDLSAQLYRGLYAQWYGVYRREERWSDAEAVNLYQTALHYQLSDSAAVIRGAYTDPGVRVDPYYAFSIKNWNRWQRFYPAWTDTVWKDAIEGQISELLTDREGIGGWEDYARAWYRESGQPWFSPPELLSQEVDSAGKDSVTYRVEYRYDEMNGELSLGFRALDSVLTELVTLPLIQHTGGGMPDTLEVTFTGKQDSVLISLDPGVTYVTMDASAKEGLYLEEIKPVPFILNRLRNRGSVEERAEAARQLGRHADNPDLQLAISDLLEREPEPRVKAALFHSLGEITQGAAGTEQIFLDALRNEHPPVVKKAAVSALGFYRGNEQVARALSSFAIGSDSLAIFKRAADSYLSTADSASIAQFSRQVLNTDTTGYKAVYILEEIEKTGMFSPDLKNMEILTGEKFPYPVRASALRMLVGTDKSEERWTGRIERLLNDSDPRIRLAAVRAVAETGIADLQTILQERLLDEYDARVYYEMQGVLSRES